MVFKKRVFVFVFVFKYRLNVRIGLKKLHILTFYSVHKSPPQHPEYLNVQLQLKTENSFLPPPKRSEIPLHSQLVPAHNLFYLFLQEGVWKERKQGTAPLYYHLLILWPETAKCMAHDKWEQK